jgi:16S rRNA (cytosine967-C5)-methyltransferase
MRKAAGRSIAPAQPGRRRPPARASGATRGPRALALDILEKVAQGGNSSLLLERVGSGPDRGLLVELVLGTLRRRAALDHLLAACSSRPVDSLDPPVLEGLRLGAYQLCFLDRVPAHAALDETVEAVKRRCGQGAAGFANGVLRACLRRLPEHALPGPADLAAYLEVTLSLPAFLAGRWRARHGDQATVRLAEALARTPPLVVRPVLSRIGAQALRLRLGGDGVRCRAGRYLEEACWIESGPWLESRAFAAGLLLVQDEAAQLVTELLAARPGDRVLDVCAAPGGKSMALADRGATVIACDRSPRRLLRLRENLARTRLEGVRLVAAAGEEPPFLGTFPRILVDAPCTGTGTLRRNPELRYRVDAARLEASRRRGGAILAAALARLAPGGRLVYATCSLEPEENEDVVLPLVAADPALTLADPAPALPAAARLLVGPDRVLRTQPADPELDGFTAFVIERRP